MKLTIQNSGKVVFVGITRPGLLTTAFVLNLLLGSFLTFLSYAVILGAPADLSNGQFLFQLMLWFAPGFWYLVYNFIDLKMYAKSTQIELSDNGVTVTSKSIKHSLSAPISFENLAGITVNQSFYQRIFGIASVAITTESHEGFSPWGFLHDEAVKFSQEVLEKHRVLIRSVKK
ncbi:MAG: PH domain-containing protein [Candidatus Pacebacteria bacterium]|nr:PH domain-containing protein [Candidatus Paceibacterota bacterium]PIR59793.1 MAG: hypothetical protein COU68_03690 [Candidatus Pacebacteria bacterium CG10_big_fil_rev_8_21_14_0_10_45_6]